ncbi:hypothetical protein [Psychromonas sp. SP041]|uniref:hypothetical protein n=1 Tax=Psychromonas sp. SP041 TaxID=1365007 RepID=UPI0010C779C9|nr:hypothetical protein [Psychromonas sp. SP041]
MTSPQQPKNKHETYNKKRIPLFRVEIVPSDDAVLLEKIKADFISKSGSPKQAVIDLHSFATKHGYFDL